MRHTHKTIPIPIAVYRCEYCDHALLASDLYFCVGGKHASELSGWYCRACMDSEVGAVRLDREIARRHPRPNLLQALNNFENDASGMPEASWKMVQDAIAKADQGGGK